MFDTEPDGSTLFSRVPAALVGAIAGAVTYLIWVLFEAKRWGQSASFEFSGLGKWFVLAGAALGFFGGLSFAVELWSNSWQSLRDESASLATAVLVLILVVFACFFAYKHFLAPS
jgi:hypothetical protein